MAPPKVSVIVPVWNGAATIGACLRSLLVQDYPSGRMEVLVVDNGSSDGSREICRSHGIVPLIESRPGAGVARNLGLENASGEVIAFTDADCEVPSEWLSRAVRALGGAPAILGAIEPVPGGNRYARARASLHAEYLAECRRLDEQDNLDRLDTANAVLWKEVLDRVGGFHPDVFPAEDRELGARIADRAGAIRFAADVVVRHRYERGLLPSMRKAANLGSMWARLPSILEETVIRRHFPEVPPLLERAREYAASPLRLARLRLAFWRQLAACILAPRFDASLARYRRATVYSIRLGATYWLREQARKRP